MFITIKLHSLKKHSFLILIFLAIGVFFSYNTQINNKREISGESSCYEYSSSGLLCNYSYKLGFPFVYLEVNKNTTYDSVRDCDAHSYQCLHDPIPFEQMNRFLFIADVIIFGLIIALIPTLIYWLLIRIFKISFRLSWLFLAIGLSVIFNLLSLTNLLFIKVPVLAFVPLLLVNLFLPTVEISQPVLMLLVVLYGVPLILATTIFYLIIWSVWRIIHRK